MPWSFIIDKFNSNLKLPAPYYLILKSIFDVRFFDEFFHNRTKHFPVYASVSQGYLAAIILLVIVYNYNILQTCPHQKIQSSELTLPITTTLYQHLQTTSHWASYENHTWMLFLNSSLTGKYLLTNQSFPLSHSHAGFTIIVRL